MTDRTRPTKAMVLHNAYGGKDAGLTENDRRMMRAMVENAYLSRTELLNKLIDPRRDIDDECGYPKNITAEQFKYMYDREGLATKVVGLYPKESWAVDPEVVENEDSDETKFEEAWGDLQNELQIWSYLGKVDEISGIGQYGVLLLGFDDGKALSEPVDGISETGEKTGNATHKLMYLRPFDEVLVTVSKTETDQTNSRFGRPTMYSIKFETGNSETQGDSSEEVKVHWHRIIHIADNRTSSEVYGTPRMQTLFNRLYDIRKISGGSGEMFWKGGFPGYNFAMDSNASPIGDDELTTLRQQIADYSNGLQRYLTTQGVTVASLDPQVADPRGHMEVQLDIIAIAMDVPKRIFTGSERGELSSTQDTKRWNQRISRRQNKYLTPDVIRPLIDRLIAAGTLPEVEEYQVIWPDMDAPSEKDKADVLKIMTEAFAKYVGGGVDQLIPPTMFLTKFAGRSMEEVEEIEKEAMDREVEMEVEEDEDTSQTEDEDGTEEE